MCTLLSAIGTGLSIYQGYAAGKTAEAQAEAQASAMEQNANFSRAQAHDAIERGGQEELKLRRSMEKHLGNQRASMATTGIDINSGSAEDVRNASISEGEHDAEAIRFNAARQRWGYINQAENLEAQAAGTRAQGKAAARNALFGGIVSGGLELYSGYKGAKSSPLTETKATDYNYYRDDINFNNSLGLAQNKTPSFSTDDALTRYANNTPLSINDQYRQLYNWNKATRRIK